MFLLKKSTLLVFAVMLVLTACGDSNKSGNSAEADTRCVVGTSTIGDCTL